VWLSHANRRIGRNKTNEKQGEINMNDEIMNEIRKAAELLGMSESDATE